MCVTAMSIDPRFRSLDADRISHTIEQLSRRIHERFPDSGLCKVCGHLLVISNHAKDRAESIARPMVALRIAALLLIALIITGLASAFMLVRKPSTAFDAIQLIQLFEAATNDILLVSAAVFFLASLEKRIKRGRALKALHELRAIAHIIDMHQLTKDPERTVSRGQPTPSSPARTMTSFELARYLDYCSEMLSLVGKIAALYIQNFDDDVALAAVNEIEALSTGLSNKIWQKLVVLHTLD